VNLVAAKRLQLVRVERLAERLFADQWPVGQFLLPILEPSRHFSFEEATQTLDIGRAYLETDAAEADRETIIRNFISGQYKNALRVVAFNAAEGWSRDVSEDVANEVLDRAYDADDTLSEGTKRFIDRYALPGEKRPPAPSVRRGDNQVIRKKA
jgi:hypothetical protein